MRREEGAEGKARSGEKGLFHDKGRLGARSILEGNKRIDEA